MPVHYWPKLFGMRNPVPEAISQDCPQPRRDGPGPVSPYPRELMCLLPNKSPQNPEWLRAEWGKVLADLKMWFWFDSEGFLAINGTFGWDWPILAPHMSQPLLGSADRWPHSLILDTPRWGWLSWETEMSQLMKQEHSWDRVDTYCVLGWDRKKGNGTVVLGQVTKFWVWIRSLLFTSCANSNKCRDLSVTQFSHMSMENGIVMAAGVYRVDNTAPWMKLLYDLKRVKWPLCIWVSL